MNQGPWEGGGDMIPEEDGYGEEPTDIYGEEGVW
jgi:hypothetical protein